MCEAIIVAVVNVSVDITFRGDNSKEQRSLGVLVRFAYMNKMYPLALRRSTILLACRDSRNIELL